MAEKMKCYLCESKKLPENVQKSRDLPINRNIYLCWHCQIKLIWLEKIGLIIIDQGTYNKLQKNKEEELYEN